jgi:hypothetical protein
MHGTEAYHAEWDKSSSKDQILHVLLHLWSLDLMSNNHNNKISVKQHECESGLSVGSAERRRKKGKGGER